METIVEFDELQIQSLFGHEAAENESPKRLQEYYFKNRIYKQVVNDLPLRIVVGHKGIGKSALFKVAMSEEANNKRLTILIKPDDIIGIGEDETDFLKLIREWKIGINQIIAQKALTGFGLLYDGWRGKLNQYGGMALDFLTSTIKVDDKVDLNDSKQAILADFLKNGKISVYMDDLDRGWQGRTKDIHRISALLNAVRDISTENEGIYFRIALRSDVYFLARTSDESTDKIEGSVVWYSWTNHEIFVLLIKRIESYFDRDINEESLIDSHQSRLQNYLKPIMEERFTGRGHWNDVPMYRVLMSLIRKRPRDLVKLLTLAAKKANERKHSIIKSSDLESVFEEYSQGRLQDTINEYRSELPDIERLVLGMKPNKSQKRASQNYIYSKDKLFQKIRNIQERGEFKWASGASAKAEELATFLFKINFITARKFLPDGSIDRLYFEENRYLSNKFMDFGYDWEVHPAFRWALQPDNPMSVFEELDINN